MLGLLFMVFIVGLLWFGCFAIGNITYRIRNYFKLDFWLPSATSTGVFILFMVYFVVVLCVELFYLGEQLCQCF
jgi:hypothetical protein